MIDILQDIEKARALSIGEDEKKAFDRMEINIRKSVILAGLQKHDGIKMLIEMYEKEIRLIDTKLLSALYLTEDKSDTAEANARKMLLLRKHWCQKFLNIFERSEKKIANVEKQLDGK